MKKPMLYCCLASEQPEPNLIPAMMPEYKPDKAVVLLTPQMHSKPSVVGLLSELRKRCPDVETQETAAFDYTRTLADMQGILDRHPGWTVMCNMTGGTKVMSVAMSEACRTAGGTWLYVDTANHSCLQYGTTQGAVPLPPVLDVPTVFNLRGYTIEGSATVENDPPGVHDLVMWMGRNAPARTHAIKSLHALAYDCKGNVPPAWSAAEAKRDARFGELWKRVCQSGLVDSDGRTLRHPEAKRILSGGWLERYVYYTIKGLPEKLGVSSVHTGTVVRSAAGVGNEIDVCFTAGNRLYLVECKARQLAKLDDEDQASITYKLDSLCDIMAGTFGRAMLASCAEIKPLQRKRCKDLSIAHRDASHLPRLADRIAEWINPA